MGNINLKEGVVAKESREILDVCEEFVRVLERIGHKECNT
jgi:hypothetical protein